MKKYPIKYISAVVAASISIACLPLHATAAPAAAASAGAAEKMSADFPDVSENADYLDALQRLASLGIITGGESFNPDGLLTREQFAKMIISATGLETAADTAKGATIFPDIASNRWSSGYINVAVNKGYITGWYDGKFHPAEAVTYAQICTTLVKALGYTDQDVPGSPPDNYILKAGELGLTDGITLNKNDGIPRWAAALIFDRLMYTNVNSSSGASDTSGSGSGSSGSSAGSGSASDSGTSTNSGSGSSGSTTGTNSSSGSSASGSSGTTFIDTAGGYIKCIVFGDSATTDTLSTGQVLTDKGVYSNPLGLKLELGSENYLLVKNGKIEKAATVAADVLKVSVGRTTENRITYNNGGREESMLLPDNITYYYQGQKADYSSLQTILQKSSSLVFNYNADKTGFEFAVVFDPVYSKPKIADNSTSSTRKAGSVNIAAGSVIIRNGEVADIDQIEARDVVYQVADIWGGNKYIQVVDNKISGEISAVLPNSLSPRTLQIGENSYEFSKDIDSASLSSSALSEGKYITAYLGHDGKIVYTEEFGPESSMNYAMVLSNNNVIKTDPSGTRSINHFVDLLFGNGLKVIYSTYDDVSKLKGKLVECTFEEDGFVSLDQMSYIHPDDKFINKEERMIGESYVSDNVQIFDIMYGADDDEEEDDEDTDEEDADENEEDENKDNSTDEASEVKVNVLEWKDLPDGTIPSGKILHYITEGEFGDVSVILTNDILNRNYRTGIVQSASSTLSGKDRIYQYTVLIDGVEYSYSSDKAKMSAGSAAKFRMSDKGIDSFRQTVNPSETSSIVQAIDSRRIKIDGRIFYLSSDVTVYYRDSKGVITVKTPADIEADETYRNVAVYADTISSKTKLVDVIFIDE